MTRLIDDDRQAVTHLNYRKHINPDPLTPLGPNTIGEHLWPVTVEHHDNGTRVGLSYMPPKP